MPTISAPMSDVQARALVEAKGVISEDADWQPLGGGRSNRVWKVTSGQKAIVCKLYDAYNSSDFFPNNPTAEITALKHLHGSGFTPELIGDFLTEHGHVILYAYVPGGLWRPGQCGLASTLRRLHNSAAPEGVRVAPSGTHEITRQAESLLNECSTPFSATIAKLRPEPALEQPSERRFIHGDLVPGNVVMSGENAVLIDWQCPALGDPCDDISTLFSPAMSILYGQATPDNGDLDMFFTEYDDDEVRNRFDLLRPFYHWRMAAYCLWKVERGARDYLDGLNAEITALKEHGL